MLLAETKLQTDAPTPDLTPRPQNSTKTLPTAQIIAEIVMATGEDRNRLVVMLAIEIELRRIAYELLTLAPNKIHDVGQLTPCLEQAEALDELILKHQLDERVTDVIVLLDERVTDSSTIIRAANMLAQAANRIATQAKEVADDLRKDRLKPPEPFVAINGC